MSTDTFDEAWMKQHGRVREWSNAYPRYAVAAVSLVVACVSLRRFGSATFVRSFVPAGLIGLSANCVAMGYMGS